MSADYEGKTLEPYQALEVELADWIGADPDHLVVCNSGSSALQLALTAIGLPKGSEVIVPEFTFVACGRAVVASGLSPVFVDCQSAGDPVSPLLIDPQLVCQAINESRNRAQSGLIPHFASRTHPAGAVRAIMAVHIHGRHCDMAGLHAIAEGIGLAVVEDMAQAHGLKPHPNSAAACWSFNRTKLVAGEEGGACWFKDKVDARKARELRNQGHSDGDWTWDHRPGGGNFRLANALAMQISNSLAQLGVNAMARAQSEVLLNKLLPEQWLMPVRIPWVYDLRLPGITQLTRDRVLTRLRGQGIAARCGFRPLSRMDEFRGCQSVGVPGRALQAATAHREVIALPLPLREGQAEMVVEELGKVLGMQGIAHTKNPGGLPDQGSQDRV